MGIKRIDKAAYGGPGFSPRTASLGEEIGRVWANCGVDTEWRPLKSVLLHRPGAEIDGLTDPDQAQMLEPLDPERAGAQHDGLRQAYEQEGISVSCVEPDRPVPPNLMFVADLLFMTPEGAFVGRPASTVRAGEERWVARRLSELGVPILRLVRGTGTFEGADAAWIDPSTVLLATGLRTNEEGATQVESTLREMNVDTIRVELPRGAMHLMGTLRFADRDLALAWPGLTPDSAVTTLRKRGFTVHFVPDLNEAEQSMALNVVTLGPRRVLMAEGNPGTRAFYEKLGIACRVVETDELHRAAGGIGCLTGVLEREPTG